MQSVYPKARKDGISATDIGDETVIYDNQTNQASCLNALARYVWNACDGTNDTESLLKKAKAAGYRDATEDEIWMAIDEFEQAGILVGPIEGDSQKLISPSRRETLRLLGKSVAAVLPVVTTISVQPAIAQISGFGNGSPCYDNSDCASNCCNPKPNDGNPGICSETANC